MERPRNVGGRHEMKEAALRTNRAGQETRKERKKEKRKQKVLGDKEEEGRESSEGRAGRERDRQKDR